MHLTFSLIFFLNVKSVDLDFTNTTDSYRLYSQVCDCLDNIPCEDEYRFVSDCLFWKQRMIASDIKECVCRAPDTPYDGVYFFILYLQCLIACRFCPLRSHATLNRISGLSICFVCGYGLWDIQFVVFLVLVVWHQSCVQPSIKLWLI